MHVQGFSSEIDLFMRRSNVFIGKPGPGCVSDALAAGLPVIVERNSRTMLQERHTANWVIETGTGMVLPNFDNIGQVLEHILEPHTYSRFHSRVLRNRNRCSRSA